MIVSYNFKNYTLTPQDNLIDSDWVNITELNTDDFNKVSSTFNIPIEFLKVVSDPFEYPRFEKEGDNTLILVRAPILDHNRKSSLAMTSVPIAFILTPKIIVTVCQSLDPSKLFPLNPKYRVDCEANIYILLLLLLNLHKKYTEYLSLLDQKLSLLEVNLKKSMGNSGLISLLHIEKNLIYFLTSLKSNQLVFGRIKTELKLSKAGKELLFNAYMENKQATNTAEIYSQIIGSLGDTLNTIVNNNVNKAMKFLTSITIILMIPTIISGIYGMNIPLPMQDYKGIFLILTFVCIVISLLLSVFFRKKDWM